MNGFYQLSMKRFHSTKNMDLTVVGSPTINNGVVSGFSASNYFTFNMTQEMLQQYATESEIVMKVKLPNSIPSEESIIWLAYKGTSTGFTLRTNNKVRWYVTSTTPNIVSLNTITLDTDLWIKGIVKNNIATLYLSIDGINWTNNGSAEMQGTQIEMSQVSRLGINNNLSNIFSGEIYIPQCYIKLGNTKYIFTLPQ